MGDHNILDLLFDSSGSILYDQVGKGKDTSNMLSDDQNAPDFNWSPSFLDDHLDGVNMEQLDLFSSLMTTNLPDDVKQQQMTQEKYSDHAYSATPSSPKSDSGISTGPYSPSNSSYGVDELIPMDFEKELFGPLDLKNYDTDELLADQVSVESFSDSGMSPSFSGGSESPMNFDFDTMLGGSPQPIDDFTVTTDDVTKVIKVVTVNNKRSRSLLSSTHQAMDSPITVDTTSPYPELRLSDEEKDLLRKEGVSLPSHLPLTREEEKVLRSVRRRIRNKASARNSRKKKQDYMEALEQRVKFCTDEKRQLEKKVTALEKQNSSLIGQLKRLQKLVTDGTRQNARTGTCAMILALSFALVLLPNYESLTGNGSVKDGLAKTASGRMSRNLLSKSDEFTSAAEDHSPLSYIPFLNNLNKMSSLVSPVKHMVDEPVDGIDELVHDSVDDEVPSNDIDNKVIHMEITKLPESEIKPVVVSRENDSTPTDNESKPVYRSRTIRMDIDDEL